MKTVLERKLLDISRIALALLRDPMALLPSQISQIVTGSRRNAQEQFHSQMYVV
jgi:hypothetical protein